MLKTKLFLQTLLMMLSLTVFSVQTLAQGTTTPGSSGTAQPSAAAAAESENAAKKAACKKRGGDFIEEKGIFVTCIEKPRTEAETQLYEKLHRYCGETGDQKQNSPECLNAKSKAGMSVCSDDIKEAKKSHDEFLQACADASFTSPDVCMNEARACAVLSMKEAESSEKDLSQNELLKAMGLTNFFANKADKKKVCSNYGQRDYDSEKRERSRTLRSAKEDLNKVNEKLTEDAEKFSEKKQELSEKFVEAQTKSREAQDESQAKLSEAGMAAQGQIMDTEEGKATLRAAIIKATGEKSRIIGARAMAMAEMSDAMIATNCLAKVEEAAAKLRGSGLTQGLQSFLTNRGEKRRRLEAVRNACFAQAEAARTTSYRDFSAQILAQDEIIASANKRIEALSNQAKSIADNNQQSIQRATEMQTKAAGELQQKQTAMYYQMQELEAAQKKRILSSSISIKNAESAVSEATDDIDSLGTRPKGTKTPSEAAAKFRSLTTRVEAMIETGLCRDEGEALKKQYIEKANLGKYVNKDLSKVEKDDDDEDSTSGRD